MFLLHSVCPPSREGLREECQDIIDHVRQHHLRAVSCREVQAAYAQAIDKEMKQGIHSYQSEMYLLAAL